MSKKHGKVYEASQAVTPRLTEGEIIQVSKRLQDKKNHDPKEEVMPKMSKRMVEKKANEGNRNEEKSKSIEENAEEKPAQEELFTSNDYECMKLIFLQDEI